MVVALLACPAGLEADTVLVAPSSTSSSTVTAPTMELLPAPKTIATPVKAAMIAQTEATTSPKQFLLQHTQASLTKLTPNPLLLLPGQRLPTGS